MLFSFEVWKSLICGYFSASAERWKFKSWSNMRRRNVYNWRVLHLQQCFPYLCPLLFKFCALWGWSGWVQAGGPLHPSLSQSGQKPLLLCFFYTDTFCCKICLSFYENANKKLEIFPTRMLGKLWNSLWNSWSYYEIVWRDVSVTVIQTQLREANVDGEIKTEDTLPHLQLFCPRSHKLTFLAVETLYFVYCFNLFTAFPLLNS